MKIWNLLILLVLSSCGVSKRNFISMHNQFKKHSGIIQMTSYDKSKPRLNNQRVCYPWKEDCKTYEVRVDSLFNDLGVLKDELIKLNELMIENSVFKFIRHGEFQFFAKKRGLWRHFRVFI
jgi:hypothetical protein